jgi:nitrate reductase cytochrome c-type subunit
MKAVKWLLICIVLGLVVVLSCSKAKLYDGRGLATGEPGMPAYVMGEPGDTNVLPRPYETAPPLVSHTVEGLEISRSANDCLDCHLEGDEIDDGHVATRVPLSHFINEYSGKKTVNTVVGTRYQCLQCHVPQTGAESLLK